MQLISMWPLKKFAFSFAIYFAYVYMRLNSKNSEFSKLVSRQCFPPFAQNTIELKEFTWTLSLRTHNIHTTTINASVWQFRRLLLCVRHIYEPFIRVLQQRKIILCFFLNHKSFFLRRFSANSDYYFLCDFQLVANQNCIVGYA